jgi:hypothetical protein
LIPISRIVRPMIIRRWMPESVSLRIPALHVAG